MTEQQRTALMAIVRQACDGRGVSVADFDRLIDVSVDAMPEEGREITGLLHLISVEAFGP